MEAPVSKVRMSWFTLFSEKCARMAGGSATFAAAFGVVVLWAVSGPFFGFSETWQIMINTFTTIVTFLLVFLIQNSQNRETRAVQLKLDEIIRATHGAHNVMLTLEKLTEGELETICGQYEAMAKAARKRMRNGKTDCEVPEMLFEKEFSV